jgi:hypothetical protein
MPKSSISLFTEFKGHLNFLDYTRKKMEKLFSEGRIVRRDIDQVYCGLYIDSITSFERKIENLFFGLLVRRLSHPSSDVIPRINLISDMIAQDIVLSGEKRYLDWFPYRYTKKRAEAYFKQGKPFSSLSSSDINMIEELLMIRNYISHRSNHSEKIFLGKVIGTLPVPPREKKPAGYLRGIKRITPSQTRFEYYMIEMADILRKLVA